MCLNTLQKFEVKSRTGYKVFINSGYRDRHSKKIYKTPHYNEEKEYRLGRWYKSSRGTIGVHRSKESYKAGFHIFTTKYAVQRWLDGIGGYMGETILHVKFREVVAKGTQHRLRVIVARQMMLVKEEKID